MRRIAATSLMVLLAAPAAAQQAPAVPGELVDRVVAVVGDTILLMSDVQSELMQLQARQELPSDEAARAALVQEILESRVNDLVLYTAAKNAGIQIRDEELTVMVDQQIAAARQQFPSDAAFHEALALEGFTPEQYRQMVTQQYRSQTLVGQYLRQKFSDAPRPRVSEAEIRQFFDTQRGALGARPATVTFQQVLIDVKPSEEAWRAARTKALEVLEELRTGGNFEVLARRYSDDPGSREQGGDLGWFRRGRMVPAFEEVVYRLRPGQTSGIVETEFGLHIIRLERVRGTERQARHILIAPEVSTADEQTAFERADSIATAVRGGASFTEMIRRYPTSGENRLERAQVDRLPPVYTQVFGQATEGEIVGPFEAQGPRASRWVVARLQERGAAGEFTLEDVRDQVRERIEEQKLLEQHVNDLRRSIYVNVML
jgi:peptidyl-prolyl cis-trans isomerase SurA